MRQMKRRLIMLLLVLALMIMHITAVVPAEEPSIKNETEEMKSEGKKAEKAKEEKGQATAEETKHEEKKTGEAKEEKGQTPAEETKSEEKKTEENKEEAAEDQTPVEEKKTEGEKSEEKKAEEVKEEVIEEAAKGETPAEEKKTEGEKVEEKKTEEIKEEAAEGEAPAEEVKNEERKVEKALEKAAEGQVLATPKANAVKDVWIDNTVDNSDSIINSVIRERDESGEGGGDTFYFKGQIPVTFSDPRPQAVEDVITEATEELKKTAKERGYKIYSIYEDTPTVMVWDNRKYETIEDDDAVLIGDTGYYTGTPEGDITRTHVASGDYGKRTTYNVVLDVTLNHAYSITVNTSGKGTVTVDHQSAKEGTNVSVKYMADKGYRLADALVRDDSVQGPDGQISAVTYGESGVTEDSISFRMPASDVTVYVGFAEIPHDHVLEKTEEVKETCEKDGTGAYWTCSICGRMFSDENGSTEIEKPVKISAAGHSWGEWVVTKEPTEEETGEKTRTCKIDPNHKETVSIPALGKEEKQEPSVEKDKDKDKEVTAPINKKNDSGSSKKTSSHSKKSSKKSSSKAKSPKTGDRTDTYFWAFMTMASFLGTICAVLVGRNKNRRS